jgi:hypothetical protein
LTTSTLPRSIQQITDTTSVLVPQFLLFLVGHVHVSTSIQATSRLPQPTEGTLHIPRAPATISAIVNKAYCLFFCSPRSKRKSSIPLAVASGSHGRGCGGRRRLTCLAGHCLGRTVFFILLPVPCLAIFVTHIMPLPRQHSTSRQTQ